MVASDNLMVWVVTGVAGRPTISSEALIGFQGGEASTGKRGWGPLVYEQKRE
jgi:hypothetical protein